MAKTKKGSGSTPGSRQPGRTPVRRKKTASGKQPGSTGTARQPARKAAKKKGAKKKK